MRPDSQLYIVPFQGGVERRMNCNLKVMNSWHSFSPNGRWLVFSSKTPSYYTHMYLTHIDENGNDSPAILIENATAANRAVNIPEFVNIPPGGLERIDAPATDFYKLFDFAVAFSERNNMKPQCRPGKRPLELDPADPRAHDNFGVALAETGKTDEAIAEYRKSLELNPGSSHTHNNLGSALAERECWMRRSAFRESGRTESGQCLCADKPRQRDGAQKGASRRSAGAPAEGSRSRS